MSKIEVNTVEPQCGTTLTLGGSGDTVALGSGASQTGFGRTGTVDWETTPKTGTFSAVNGTGYFANTTASTFTMNLPAGSAGNIVSVADYAGTWDTYNLTVTPNGTDKIGSVNASVDLNTAGQSVTFVYVDGVQGWVNTMDSTSNVRANEYVAATGGNCTVTCGNDKIHIFTSPGTLTVSAVGNCATNNTISYMVVGGGGGGSGPYGAGGGAGGFREVKSPSTASGGAYTASPLDGYPTPGNRVILAASPGSYAVVVGGGGTAPGAGDAKGCNGSDSSFGGIVAAGGGGAGAGGSPPNPTSCGNGGPGGSGGGAGGFGPGTRCGGVGNTPSTTPPQGQSGGTATQPGSGYSSAGGGGAGGTGSSVSSPGSPAPGETGGPAGDGVQTGISPASFGEAGPTGRYFAGGGGGGSWNPPGPAVAGTGGLGGGSNGRQNTSPFPGSGDNAKDAVDNMGGGAGGGGSCSPGARNGGSGIVIIRYRYQ
jgi:hypothetical protein